MFYLIKPQKYLYHSVPPWNDLMENQEKTAGNSTGNSSPWIYGGVLNRGPGFSKAATYLSILLMWLSCISPYGCNRLLWKWGSPKILKSHGLRCCAIIYLQCVYIHIYIYEYIIDIYIYIYMSIFIYVYIYIHIILFRSVASLLAWSNLTQPM